MKNATSGAVIVGRASYEVPHGTSNADAATVASALAEATGERVRVFCRLCTATIDLAEGEPSAAAVRLATERLNIRIAQIGDRLMRPFCGGRGSARTSDATSLNLV
jgi:hypothetical protein